MYSARSPAVFYKQESSNLIKKFGDVVLKVDPTYTLIMSDRVKDLNIRRNSKKKKKRFIDVGNK